jgi:glycogen debranching enzyme
MTGDAARLERVWQPLVHYYAALQEYLQQGNGLYMTDWASMDNSTRNVYLDRGGTGIDISAEMVLFARQLTEIGGILGKAEEAGRFAADADRVASTINESMWDAQRRFYFDLTLDGKRAPVKTVAAFWTLLANVASRHQAEALAAELENPKTFKRLNRVPTLAADEPGYVPSGGYWKGSVWAPTDTMVMRGLENYGYHALARDIALNHLNVAAQVFEKTGTIWENYAPDEAAQGNPARKDFAGWSAIGPVLYLMEYAIGLRADAPKNTLAWNLTPGVQHGCERYRFNGHVASLVAKPLPDARGRFHISVESDGPFKLLLASGDTKKECPVETGRQQFQI